MSEVKITADISQIKQLGDDYRAAKEVGLRRVTERGEQLVREEVPKATHNLEQGVSSEVKIGRGLLQGEIIVSARTGRLSRRRATLHLTSGKTKQVTLRAVPFFNYPEAVATGTGEFGPKGVAITPKKAQALLVPVTSVPTLNGKPQAYIESNGQLFIARRSMKGMKPNRYDQRAEQRLGAESQNIFNSALADFAGDKS